MASVFTPLIANPTEYKTSQLNIPAASNLQILKYIADFSDLPAGLFTYTLTPNSQQTFGCARMVKIDARNLLMPVTFAISDTLSDIITIMPGDYGIYHLDGSATDTYTVTTDFISNGASGTFQFGYVKLYFYNYLDLSMMAVRAKQSIQVTSYCTLASFPKIILSCIAPGKGMPIIEQILMTANYTTGGGGILLLLTPTLLASQGWIGPNPWQVFYNSGTVTTFVFEPNTLLPPGNIAVTPANEGSLLNPYIWTLTPSTNGAPTAGVASFLVRYRFN